MLLLINKLHEKSITESQDKILKVQNIPTNNKLFNHLLQTIKQFIFAYCHNEQEPSLGYPHKCF